MNVEKSKRPGIRNYGNTVDSLKMYMGYTKIAGHFMSRHSNVKSSTYKNLQFLSTFTGPAYSATLCIFMLSTS